MLVLSLHFYIPRQPGFRFLSKRSRIESSSATHIIVFFKANERFVEPSSIYALMALLIYCDSRFPLRGGTTNRHIAPKICTRFAFFVA